MDGTIICLMVNINGAVCYHKLYCLGIIEKVLFSLIRDENNHRKNTVYVQPTLVGGDRKAQLFEMQCWVICKL